MKILKLIFFVQFFFNKMIEKTENNILNIEDLEIYYNLENKIIDYKVLCPKYFINNKQFDDYTIIVWKNKGNLYTYIETEKQEDAEEFEDENEEELENGMKVSINTIITTKNGKLHSLEGEPALHILKENYCYVENYGGVCDIVTDADTEEYEAFYEEGRKFS